jgi:hypothetical protein
MTLTNRDPIDQLGEIKAEIAKLEAIEKTLRDEIAARGPGAWEADMFRATVSVSDREKIDWKAIAEKLGPSRQLVTANTSSIEIVTVKVTARNGRVAA